jgi:hypothetical protein
MRTFSMTCCEGETFIAFDDRRVRREALRDFDGASGRQAVARLAAQNNFAVCAGDIDVSAAGAGCNLALQRRCVGRYIEVDHRHQAPLVIKYGNVGRADFFSLDVEHRLRHRQSVGDFGGANDRCRERGGKTKRPRLIERHLQGPHLVSDRAAWAALLRPSRTAGLHEAETSRRCCAGGRQHGDPDVASR